MRIINKISAQNGLTSLNHDRCSRSIVYWFCWLFLLFVFLGGHMSAQAATPPNTELLNTVYVAYKVGENAVVETEDSVATITAARTPAQISFYTVFEGGDLMSVPDADYSHSQVTEGSQNDQWQTIDSDLPSTVNASETSSFAAGETLLIRVEDFDQNVDSSVRETIVITVTTNTGETETLRFTETAPDSGVFVGALPTDSGEAAAGNYNGTLRVETAAEITALYRDDEDSLDVAVTAAVIDPASMVFDSITGEPLNGVEIRLIHDKNGRSARVYDTDGSEWPSQVVSGSAVSARSSSKLQGKGEFRFPRVPAGEYRLEIIPPPGYRYPSQQSDTQLSTLGDIALKVKIGSRGERFELLRAVEAVELHVPLDPFEGRFGLIKTVDRDVVAVGDILEYRIAVRNHDNRHPLTNVYLKDLLPPGFRYIVGSARYASGESMPGNRINVDGRQLKIQLDDLVAGQQLSLSYQARVGAGYGSSEEMAVNTVQGFSNDAVSNIARAEVKLLDELMREKGLLIGRVFTGACDDPKQQKGLQDARLYLETGRSVVTDKNGRWHMAGVNPGMHVVQLDTTSLPPGYVLAPCRMTARNAGRSFSEFVELRAGNIWRVDYHLRVDAAQADSQAVSAANPATKQPGDPLAQFGNDYVTKADSGLEILWPPARYVPAISSIKIAVKYKPSHKLKVLLNGEPVNPLNKKDTVSNKAKTVAVGRWTGVDIKQKDSVLVAVVTDKAGREVDRVERNVHFTEYSVSAELVETESRLMADGKQRPVITLRLEDEDGYTPRPRTHGYFTLEHGHWVPIQTEQARSNRVALNNRGQNGRYEYTVSDDGLVRIELEPTARSGEVVLNVLLSNGETTPVRAWLKPVLRDWIMVGFAKGTVGYKTLSGNLQTLNDLGEQEGYYHEGQLSFFAKGRIKGDYLLTVAYNSAKRRGDVGAQLQGSVDPDAWYTLYGDHQTEQYEAPGSSKLYLKLEKEQFSALFGDYHTSMDVTELSRYERVLHGLKTEYKGDNISYSAFASQTGNKHQRDEIAPNGTSGLYHLSYQPLSNSEKMVLETRDRTRPELILKSRTLTRHVDYSIDYLQRSLLFKFPVSALDDAFNPVLIVADYEVAGGESGKKLTAGGRIAYTTDDKKLTTGLSYFREGDEQQQYGVDARYTASDNLNFRAEVAASQVADTADETKAMAWLAEAEYHHDELHVRAYGREEQQGFGLAQQSGQGVRTLGLETRYALALDSVLSFNTSHRITAGSNGSRDTERTQADIEWGKDFDDSQFSFGVRHTEENSAVGQKRGQQITIDGRTRWLDDTVTLSGRLEKSVSSQSPQITPDRARLGIDYQLSKNITLVAEQEWVRDRDDKRNNTRLGLRATPWAGGSVHSGFVREQKVEIGRVQRDYANFGLTQQWQVNETLSFNASVDKVETLRHSPILATGDEALIPQHDDYTAFSLGAGWNDEEWSATGRIEYLDGKQADKTSLTLGAVRELNAYDAVAASLRMTETDNENGNMSRKTALGLHLAARPDAQANWLNRLDLIDERKVSAGESTLNQKLVYNGHYNRRFGESDGLAFSFHQGMKLSVMEKADGSYRSLLDTMQAAVKLDVTESWDVGAHGGYLYSWEDKTRSYVAGVAVGFSPVENTRVEVGYNFSGFNDEDFTSGQYTQQGPYIDLNYKLDQELMQELREWNQ